MTAAHAISAQAAFESSGPWPTEMRKISKASLASVATASTSDRSATPDSSSASRDSSPQPPRERAASDGVSQLCALPVRNTFIHIPSEEPLALRRTNSAPSILAATPAAQPAAAAAAEPPEEIASERMMWEHKHGACRPCAYFLFKEDGCRNGPDCEFCHLCTSADIKKFKRERAKAAKQMATAARQSASWGRKLASRKLMSMRSW